MDAKRKTLFRNKLAELLDSDTDAEYFEKLTIALQELTYGFKLFKDDIMKIEHTEEEVTK